MSKLDELIKELCPNGVNRLSTNDIKIDSFWLMPATPNYIESGVPYITSKNVRNGKIDFTNVSYISEEDYKNISSNRSILVGDILVTMIGTIGEVCIVDKNIKFYGQNLYLVRLNKDIIDIKYFYYYITSASIKNSLVTKKNASSQGYIKAGSIENLKVPVPPLEVQREIVRILDSFTLLTAELTARKKQYEYYRDILLVPPCDDVEKISLSDVVNIKNGKDYKHLKEGKYPVYGSGGIMTYKSEYTYDKPSVLIPRKGSLSNLFYVEEPFWNVDTVFYTEIDESKLIPKYLYYLLQKEHLESLNTAGGVPSLTQTVLNKLCLVIPSLNRQRKIVDCLDNFEKICNDLNIGLPAEIEARKKQYEYYRDVLLTFAETGSTILTDRPTDRPTVIKLIQYVFGYAPVRLDEIATIIRGGNFQKKDFVKNGRPCIHYGQMYTHFGVCADETITFVNEEVFSKSKIARHGDIVMAVTSENVEDVCSCTAWLGDEEVAISGHTAIIRHNQNAKYMSYFFHSSAFFEQKKRLAHGTKVIEVTPSKLGGIEILLPTIEEQSRIVSILDRFDSLCNDITNGLPAEIEARKKQYEYYRDKLLEFK